MGKEWQIALSKDMCVSEVVQSPLMVITDQERHGAEDTVFEAWNLGHNLSPILGSEAA